MALADVVHEAQEPCAVAYSQGIYSVLKCVNKMTVLCVLACVGFCFVFFKSSNF